MISFMRTLSLLFLALMVVGSLSGCAKTRDALGLTNKAPDEFAVVDNPPLSMPPDFSLPPPRPGAENPRGENPSEKAAQALFGGESMKAVPQQGVTSLQQQKLSPSEAALIQQSGALQADPRVRSELVKDSNTQVSATRQMINDLLFWKKKKEPGTVVDPVAEAGRLKTAKEQAQPVSSGVTTGYDQGKKVTIP